MKILYVSLEPINSGSSAATCSVMNIVGLLELGHDVEILTIKRAAHMSEIDERLRSGCTISFINEDESISATSSHKPAKKTLKRRILNIGKAIYRKFSLYNYSYFYLSKITSKSVKSNYYDCVISSSDPVTSHKAVERLKDAGIKFGRVIQHWGDPMADDITKKSIWPRAFVRRVEFSILKQADKIVYLSPLTAEKSKAHFKRIANKIEYAAPASEFNKEFLESQDAVLKLAYCGIYYSKIRDIKPLYNAASCSSNVHLQIAGTSDITLEENSNVSVLGHIPHSEATRIEAESDVIVCLLNKTGTQIPGKLYYYVGTNKQILILHEDGNMPVVEFLKTFDRFVFAENTVEGIKEAIEHLKNHRVAKPSDYLSPAKVAARIIS